MALFALLKTFAPGYNPWYLYYRMGLEEFLAACGVHEPSPSSWSTGGCPLVLHEGAGEGPRRIIFDLETISLRVKGRNY